MKKEIIYPDNSDLEYLNYLLFELYKVIKFDNDIVGLKIIEKIVYCLSLENYVNEIAFGNSKGLGLYNFQNQTIKINCSYFKNMLKYLDSKEIKTEFVLTLMHELRHCFQIKQIEERKNYYDFIIEESINTSVQERFIYLTLPYVFPHEREANIVSLDQIEDFIIKNSIMGFDSKEYAKRIIDFYLPSILNSEILDSISINEKKLSISERKLLGI